jgi:hypothetical protein
MGQEYTPKTVANVIKWAHCRPERSCGWYWTGPDMPPKDVTEVIEWAQQFYDVFC